jgi:hypothetical protein
MNSPAITLGISTSTASSTRRRRAAHDQRRKRGSGRAARERDASDRAPQTAAHEAVRNHRAARERWHRGESPGAVALEGRGGRSRPARQHRVEPPRDELVLLAGHGQQRALGLRLDEQRPQLLERRSERPAAGGVRACRRAQRGLLGERALLGGGDAERGEVRERALPRAAPVVEESSALDLEAVGTDFGSGLPVAPMRPDHGLGHGLRV